MTTPNPKPRERDETMAERLSNTEALMWSLETEPQMNPSGAGLSFYDQPIDKERFLRFMRPGIATMPRLYQRLAPSGGLGTNPRWAPDPGFDLDHHVLEIDLGGEASERDALDLAARLYQEPLDRTHPLWRFVLIKGLADGSGAVYSIIHHVVADGIGQLRISELYLQAAADTEPPEEFDLEAFVTAETIKDAATHNDNDDNGRPIVETAGEAIASFTTQQLGLGRKVLGEMMIWPADPERAVRAAGKVATVTSGTLSQLKDLLSDEEDDSGSPLWVNRSANRHLEFVRVGLADLKAASKALDASINELFVVGLAEATDRYHQRRNVELENINTSIVVSTRTDSGRSGNAFTPVPIRLPGPSPTMADRLASMKQASDQAIHTAKEGVGLMSLAGLLHLLPASTLASTALERARRLDFATSNLRGSSRPVYCAGVRATRMVTMGPLSGTPMNATAISFDGHFDIGMFIDPKAIDSPSELAEIADEVFAELVDTAVPNLETAPTTIETTQPKPKAKSR